MSNLIKPERLKGFRDYLPERMIPRSTCWNRRGVYTVPTGMRH